MSSQFINNIFEVVFSFNTNFLRPFWRFVTGLSGINNKGQKEKRIREMQHITQINVTKK